MKKKILSICSILLIIFIIIGLPISNLIEDEPQKLNSIEQEQNKWPDKGIFSEYYEDADKLLKTLTLDEKIGQLFLVRYPDQNQISLLKQYNFGGYILFAKDFKNKQEKQVQDEINQLQEASKIPLLTAVDEEGGTVVRVSSNKNLANSKFRSPMELYAQGGFEAITQDTIEKSKVLSNLGINLNLAPVIDVSTNPSDFMYKRTLGQGTELTSNYAKIVIEASKENNVSFTLKHFPGYGNNVDTHTGSARDNRTYEYIMSHDIPPFQVGIEAGAEAVLVSHNIVTCIDPNNPASLSSEIHKLLREDLDFTGIIITDDLAMAAVSEDEDATIKAILAGNNIMITTDYEKSIKSVEIAIQEGKITEEMIDELVFRTLAWKYYKGLFSENP